LWNSECGDFGIGIENNEGHFMWMNARSIWFNVEKGKYALGMGIPKIKNILQLDNNKWICLELYNLDSRREI